MTQCYALSRRRVVWAALQTSLQPMPVRVSMPYENVKLITRRTNFLCSLTKWKNLLRNSSKKVNEWLYWEKQVPLQRGVLVLEIPVSKWFTMNTEQRRNHFSKVQSTQVSEADETCSQIDALKSSNIVTSESNHTGQTTSLKVYGLR